MLKWKFRINISRISDQSGFTFFHIILFRLYMHLVFRVSHIFAHTRCKCESRLLSLHLDTVILYYCSIYPSVAASPRKNLSCKVACALSYGYKAKRVGKRIASMCYYVSTPVELNMSGGISNWHAFLRKPSFSRNTPESKELRVFLIPLLTRVIVE